MSDWKDLAPGEDYYYIPNVYGGESYQTPEECVEKRGSGWLVCDHKMIDKYYEMRSELEAMRARAEAAERLAQFASGDGWNELPKLREKVASLEAENKECMSRFLHEQRMAEVEAERDQLRESLGEALSYFPKVPTKPYEKEMAKQILKLEAERDRWKAKYEASEWVRKDTALRTYDGLTSEIDQLRRDNEGLVEALREIVEDFPLAEYTAFAIALREIAREAIVKFGGKK